MKTKHEKRQDALIRMLDRQREDEAKLAGLKADRKKMEASDLDNDATLIKHGLFAGFSVKNQKSAADEYIKMVAKTVARRTKEIHNLNSLVGGR